MKKFYFLSLATLIILFGCAAPKMLIIQKPHSANQKFFNETYYRYNESGARLSDTLKRQCIELKAIGDYSDYEIIWIKFHPENNLFIAEIAGIKEDKKAYHLTCVDLQNFKELWSVTLNKDGKISATDVTFVGNKYVVFLNNQSEVVSLNMTNGNEIWRIEKPKTSHLRYYAEANGLLLWRFGRELAFLNPDSGSSIWSAELGSDYPSEPVLINNNLYTLCDGISKYDFNKGQLWKTNCSTCYKVDHTATDVAVSVLTTLLTGYAASQYTPPDYYYGCYSQPILLEKTLYFTANGQLIGINNDDGKILWKSSKIEDLKNISEMKFDGDTIYAKCGGYTLFYNGSSKLYYFKLTGLQGIMAYDKVKKDTLWMHKTYNKSEDTSPVIHNFFVLPEEIITVTENEITTLSKDTGKEKKKVTAEELRIGNFTSAQLINNGLIVKGKEGISRVDLISFEPTWSMAVNTKKSNFQIIPRESAKIPFWKKNWLVNFHNRIFFNSFFNLDPSNKIVSMVTDADSLVGFDINSGEIKYKVPVISDKFYIDYQKNRIVTFNDHSVDILDIKKVMASL